MKFYVYMLCRDVECTDPFYVGKGKGRRILAHEEEVACSRGNNILKHRAIKKRLRVLGFVPKKIVASGLTEAEAIRYERQTIALFGRMDTGTGSLTNLTDGGEGTSGAVVSASTREKKRAALLGRPRPQDVIEKISGSNHYAFGKAAHNRGKPSPLRGTTRPPDVCRRISESHKALGKTLSDEHKRKFMSAGRAYVITKQDRARRRERSSGRNNPMYGVPSPMTGKHHTAETRAKISKFKSEQQFGEANPFFGKKHSPETLERMRAAQQRRRADELSRSSPPRESAHSPNVAGA